MANYGPVYEYWASLSKWPSGPVYSLTDHQNDVFNSNEVSLGKKGREFFIAHSGLTPPGNYNIDDHITAYFDLVGGTWEAELLANALSTYGGTDWATQRTNLFPDPRAVGVDVNYWGTPGGATLSNVVDQYGSWVRATRSIIGNQRIIEARIGTPAYATSTAYRARFLVRGSIPDGTWTVNFRPSISSATGAVTFGSFSLPTTPGDIIEVNVTGTTSATTTGMGATSGFTIIQNGAAVGTTLDITGLIVETLSTSTNPVYFDGNSGSTDTERYLWSGTADASTSMYQTRTMYMP